MTQDEIMEFAQQADVYADAMDIGGKNYIGLRDEYFAKLVDAKATAKERVACFDAAYDAHATTAVLEAIRARGEA